ncbi:MAG TPA: sulfatase-like hydrolase/transferase [Gaiellales bacterium]|nr:sulfatase-like hydrolase/transferase [Gaiellales bacterium]
MTDSEGRAREAAPFLVLGFFGEIAAKPDMLADYARVFAGRTDTTLVVLAPGFEAGHLTREIQPLAEALGLDRDGSADVVVLTQPGAGDELAPIAGAVYTRFNRNGSLASVPQVGDAAELARLVDEARSAPAIRAELQRREREQPSYLLVTYDSCRLDVLQEAGTPVLDSYAQIVAAQTPANFTYAAHQAFFVGMLPNALEPLPYHNRFVNQLFALGAVGEIQVVDKACAHRVHSDVNLVAGLAAAGYQTVGAGAMNWFKQQALTQWFDKFAYTGTDARAQIDFVRSEIDPSRPFFGFVNFGETHDPFDFEGKPDRCPIEVQSRLIEWPPVQNGVPVGRDSDAWEHQKRSAEFLDAQLPRLFDGLPGNTIVILCGDHGEAFGEDGYWGHGVNHPSVLTVPLAIFRLDRKPL